MKPRASKDISKQTVKRELTRIIKSGYINLFKDYVDKHPLIASIEYHDVTNDLLREAVNTIIRVQKSNDKRVVFANCLDMINYLLAMGASSNHLIKPKGRAASTLLSLALRHIKKTPNGKKVITCLLKASSLGSTLAIEFPFILPWLAYDPALLDAFLLHYPQLSYDFDYRLPLLRTMLDANKPPYVAWLTTVGLIDDTALQHLNDAHRLKALKILIGGAAPNTPYASILLTILKNYPDLLLQLSPQELLAALAISIKRKLPELTWKILQCDIDYNAASKLLVTEDQKCPSKEMLDFLMKKGINVFNHEDTFQRLQGFVVHRRYDEINRMLSQVDREKALKSIEEPLRAEMCNNTYHVPDINEEMYCNLKRHGFLSDAFIASVENMEHHLGQMKSKTDWHPSTDRLTVKSTVRIMGTFVRNPALNRTLESKVASLESVEFFDSGTSKDSWTYLLDDMISLAPAPDAKHGKPCIDVQMNQMEEKEEPNFFFRSLAAKGWTFLRTQGRTILLKNKAQDILAIKVKKDNEDPADLHREAKATEALKKQSAELKLQSYFPEPVGISHISHLLTWLERKVSTDELEKFTKMVGTCEQYRAYLYQVDSLHQDYFTYLHDTNLTSEKFIAANRMAVNDLCKLLANGVVFHQLADIFHNKEHVMDRDDKGRYIVLSNLLSWFALAYKEPAGSGRLTGWQEAVRFLNIRGTGLADFGDFAPLNDFLGDGSKLKYFFGAALKMHGDNTGNYLIANFLAEYQFVLYLNAGFKACKETKSMTDESQVRKIWQETANLLVNNCALAISILTPQTEEAARRFLLSTVNVERLGRQMQFWMRETENGFDYLEHVKKNSIPSDIYGSEVKVEVDTKRFRKDTFNPKSKDGRELGFAIDGEHPDLGPVNGQEPVKEKDNLFAWMISAIFNAYHEHRLTLADVRRCDSVKDKQQKEVVLKHSFGHLPTRQYHATLFAMTKRQLDETKPVTRGAQKEIVVTSLKARNHKRNYAAATIQEAWHAHKFQRVTEEKKVESGHLEINTTLPKKKI